MSMKWHGEAAVHTKIRASLDVAKLLDGDDACVSLVGPREGGMRGSHGRTLEMRIMD